MSVELEDAHVTHTGVFVDECRLITSWPCPSKDSKIRVGNSVLGMALESKVRKGLAVAVRILVCVLSRQPRSLTGSQEDL